MSKNVKKPHYRNIQVYPILKDGKLSWYLGDSDYSKNRITSGYSPLSTEEMIEAFEDRLKWLAVTCLDKRIIEENIEDIESMSLQETIDFVKSFDK